MSLTGNTPCEGLGCTLNCNRKAGFRLAPAARREHPDGEIIRAGAHARGASRLDEWRIGDSGRARRPGAPGASVDVEEALEEKSATRLDGSVTSAAMEKAGYRNGYRPSKMKTAEGRGGLFSPASSRYARAVRVGRAGGAIGAHAGARAAGGRTLCARAVERDIEDAFTDETGRRLLSRAAVSEITEKLWAEYEDFCKRALSDHAVAYLLIDGIAERLRPGQRREAVLSISACPMKQSLASLPGPLR